MSDSNLLLYTIIMLVLMFLLLLISYIKILKKEEIPVWVIFIPFYNVYRLFKIVKIPFWTIFIPIVNIVVMILFPYKLAKQFRCNTFTAILGIFIPIIIIPYIAFSKKHDKDKEYRQNYLKTIDDVNKLEQNLSNNNDMIVDDLIIKKPIKNEPKSNINNFVEDIESTIINDEFVYDEPDQIEENQSEEIIPDLVDLNGDSQIKIEDVELLESDLETNVKQNKKVIENIEEYKIENVVDENIAFGGKEVKEFKNNTVNDELKCEKCGSSLVGANGFCPGCGAKL